MMHTALPMLEAGDVATITGITGITGTQVAAKRLVDMGFVRGARLEMIRPGRPCIVQIAGVCVGLGAAFQRCIQLA